jgi:hypothetical protein
LQKEITQINDQLAEQGGRVAFGAAYRSRSGESGLTSLRQIEVPVEGRFALTDDVALTLKLSTVQLQTGTLDLSDREKARRFGAYAAISSPLAGTRDFVYRGTGGTIGLEMGGLALELGSTPTNFPVANVIGSLRYAGASDSGQFTYSLDLSRRPVMDTLLSYAGARDTVTGKLWGGVTQSGLRFDTAYDYGRFGVYLGGGAYNLDGKNVKSNQKFELTPGIFYRAINEDNRRVTLGLNVSAVKFKENLRYTTFGQGGYFSPQNYVSLNLPIDYAGRTERLAYQFKLIPSYVSFKENATPYFFDSQLMAQATAIQGATTTYAGQTKKGFGVSTQGAVEYRATPQVFVGGAFSTSNAQDFRLGTGLVYLKYQFEPTTGAIQFPPSPMATSTTFAR